MGKYAARMWKTPQEGELQIVKTRMTFGSDEEEESEEAKRLREERLAQHESKKAKNLLLLPSLPSH